MPSSSSIKQQIRGIATESFTQHLKHNEAIKYMKENEDVLEGMIVLGQRKEADVTVEHGVTYIPNTSMSRFHMQ